MNVESDHLYSMKEIARLKLLPKAHSLTAIKNIVLRDRMEGNVLKVKMLGTGPATRVYIKGSNLIKFLKQK